MGQAVLFDERYYLMVYLDSQDSVLMVFAYDLTNLTITFLNQHELDPIGLPFSLFSTFTDELGSNFIDTCKPEIDHYTSFSILISTTDGANMDFYGGELASTPSM